MLFDHEAVFNKKGQKTVATYESRKKLKEGWKECEISNFSVRKWTPYYGHKKTANMQRSGHPSMTS